MRHIIKKLSIFVAILAVISLAMPLVAIAFTGSAAEPISILIDASNNFRVLIIGSVICSPIWAMHRTLQYMVLGS